MENKTDVILEVKGLKKYFPLQKNIFGKPKVILRAVDNVSFKLEAGKTVGIVGESGCGKTTLGRTILQLYDTTGGKTLYYAHNIYEFSPKYFINTIKKLPLYSWLFNFYNNKLAKLNINNVADFNDLEEYRLAIDSLDEKNRKYGYKMINLLNNVSSLTGGLILGDVASAKSILLSLCKNTHLYEDAKKKLLKEKDENKQNSLKNQINVLSTVIKTTEEQLDSIKSELSKFALFSSLEANLETGLNLALLTKKEMRLLRTEIQLIFQDPYSSLPPRMTVGSILTEAVKVHKIVEKDKVSDHIHQIMKKCGLQPQYYDRYPHEFSGGQRQRICIARALAVNPKLVICDEPVSALDVSIQAQIINLLRQLQNDLGLTYMFISHDLSVVKYITDSIIVMYLGNMMEVGNTADIFKNPLHPYTQALFSAVPVPDPDAKMQRIILKGDIPSPANPPKGCKFHTRCVHCMSVCKLHAPKFIDHGSNHIVACHLYDEEIMNNLSKYDEELKRAMEEEALREKEALQNKNLMKSIKGLFKKHE